jgi:hypothetical protein
MILMPSIVLSIDRQDARLASKHKESSVRLNRKAVFHMKTAISIVALFLFMGLCSDAAAQFSQPPPNRTAPACDLRKKIPVGEPIISECKRHPIVASMPSLECVSSRDYVSCATSVWVMVDGQWVEIDTSTAIHDWAYIVDGQEHYLSPMYRGWFGFECGRSRQGYVRAAVAGGSVTYAFRCTASPVVESW